MRNKIVEQVFNDYSSHLDDMEDNDYSSIYRLYEILERYWNGSGANLKYNLDIKDGYLYLENIKICEMDKLLFCSAESDSVIYQLRNDKSLYICIQWVDGRDAFISQIYIENNKNDEDCKMLYNTQNLK